MDMSDVNPDPSLLGCQFTSLVSVSILAVAWGSKTFGEKFKTLTYSRVLVILLYTTSWAFSVNAVFIVSTINNMTLSCTLVMLSCDFLYTVSKVVAYIWLIERAHLVTGVKTTRLRTTQYRLHMLFLCPYVIIFCAMVVIRYTYLKSTGICTIGLQDVASIPLLVYDFIFNLYLTWLFLKTLKNLSSNNLIEWKTARLRRLIGRTLVASVVCLLISFINVFCVVAAHGNQRGIVCLIMCTVDVTINVVTVHWVTTTGNTYQHTQRKSSNTNEATDNTVYDIDDTRYEEPPSCPLETKPAYSSSTTKSRY